MSLPPLCHHSGKAPLGVRLARRLRPDPDTGCLEWVGDVSSRGYGKIRSSAPPYSARYTHRVAWELEHGEIPDGMFVCHSCDNRLCCNATHLFLGTSADNTRDMVTKGRQARGERVGTAVLTEADVVEILRLRSDGWTYDDIADRFDTGSRNVGKICRRERWKHIEVPA